MRKDIEHYFPHPPYASQLSMANALSELIQQGRDKAIMVESPTGTGKTYALLAGTISWMLDNPGLMDGKQEESNSLPAWIPKAGEARGLQLLKKKKEDLKLLKKISEKQKRQHKVSGEQKLEWEVQDLEDEEAEPKKMKRPAGLANNYAIMEQTENAPSLPKIVFVSRTHTQLSQVMESIAETGADVRSVSLASKDHLCVHPKLEKTRVNEKCQYILSHGGCPYYYDEAYQEFLDRPLKEAKGMGDKHGVCSYYGVRKVMGVADIICLPYSSILTPDIRNKLGININNAIVIFDEAHNLIEQQLSLKSPQISYQELEGLSSRMDDYREKHQARLSASNLRLVSHMIEVCRALMSALVAEVQKLNKEPFYSTSSRTNLFWRMKISEIQLYRMKVYISLSNFDQKLAHLTPVRFQPQVVNKFIDFLSALTSADSNPLGTIVIFKSSRMGDSKDCSLKILALESTELASIVKKSRVTILAGGTMDPISSFVSIFTQNQINCSFLKYDHVVKPEQCSVTCISKLKGGLSSQLRFTYKQMESSSLNIMKDSCQIIRAIVERQTETCGVVVFIQSYQVIELLRQSLGGKVGESTVFYDSSKGNSTFEQYQAEIKEKKRSALLVSVMGGRLSEGINFADELARAIIVLGLPYPNLKAPEIIQKMNYLDSKVKAKQIGFSAPTLTHINQELQESGRSYYENCCLKSLNQTIGRGIRHIGDYAHIYLIDDRFTSMSHKLSTWLTRNMHVVQYFQS